MRDLPDRQRDVTEIMEIIIVVVVVFFLVGIVALATLTTRRPVALPTRRRKTSIRRSDRRLARRYVILLLPLRRCATSHGMVHVAAAQAHTENDPRVREVGVHRESRGGWGVDFSWHAFRGKNGATWLRRTCTWRRIPLWRVSARPMFLANRSAKLLRWSSSSYASPGY